jgi:hypothetical protein
MLGIRPPSHASKLRRLGVGSWKFGLVSSYFEFLPKVQGILPESPLYKTK